MIFIYPYYAIRGGLKPPARFLSDRKGVVGHRSFVDRTHLRRWIHDIANSLVVVLGGMDMGMDHPGPRGAKRRKEVRAALDHVLVQLRHMQAELHGSLDAVLLTPTTRDKTIMSMAEDFGVALEVGIPSCQNLCIQEGAKYRANLSNLQRVLHNIWGNSQQAGATRFMFRVSCEALTGDRPCCLLVFTDNGSGMSQRKLNSIGVIYKGEDGVPHGQGTGVIRTLCAEMGISVQWNSIQGLGTEATLRWPKVMPASDTASHHPHTAPEDDVATPDSST